uniref:glycylpeptide N-tetradecanoyltransferase n=1 Tax=viral metagenome TaxID=1070528 RepID=A0A6C0H6G7_9ZZZZ
MTDKLSFWKNKPVKIRPQSPVTTIKSGEELVKMVSDEITNSKIQLDYQLINMCDTELQPIIEFINKNYMNNNSDHMLSYNTDMIKFFLGDPKNSLVLAFYPRTSNNSNKKIVGVVCGSKHKLCIRGKDSDSFECMDINFLCVAKQLRKIHVSSYIINIITRECVERFGVICAGYTTGVTLKIPHFSKKWYYHRLINIDKTIQTQLFSEEFDSEVIRKVYNTFNYQTVFKRQHALEYHGRANGTAPNCFIQKLASITQALQNYCHTNYDVYFEKTLTEIQKIFDNPNFHVFLVMRDNQITDFVSLFNIDTMCLDNGETCRNGYLYYYYFSNDSLDHKQNVLEMIAEYCYQHNIFDLLTVCDPFGVSSHEYKTIKFLRGTGSLNYYMYNMKMHKILNENNGLVTI